MSNQEVDNVQDSSNMPCPIATNAPSQAQDARHPRPPPPLSPPQPTPSHSPPSSPALSPRPGQAQARLSTSSMPSLPQPDSTRIYTSQVPPPPPPPPPRIPLPMAYGAYASATPPHPFYNQHMMMAPPFYYQAGTYQPYLPFPPPGRPMMPAGYNMQFMIGRPWATDPCDCFSDLKNSFLTCWCPCITFGQIAEILNEGQTPWWENAWIYFVLSCITCNVGTCCYDWPYRMKMRKKYVLKGTVFFDLIFTMFCARLALCQQYRQLDRLGFDVPLGWEANKERQRQKALENVYQYHQVAPPHMELGMYR